MSDVEIYLRDGSFESDVGFVNLHPTQGTHWAAYLNQNNCCSYGCSPPQKPPSFIIERNGHCFIAEYKLQGLTNKTDSYCAAYCFYIIYLTKA